MAASGIGLILACAVGMTAYAQEQLQPDGYILALEEATAENIPGVTELNKIMVASEDVDAKAVPDSSAQTVTRYHSGDSIFVTGETQDGWYRIKYQDVTGYVQAGQVSEMEVDVEALGEEFAVEEAEGALVVEAVERQRDESRRSKVWGTVIVLLVVGIFGTGIVSVVKARKKK